MYICYTDTTRTSSIDPSPPLVNYSDIDTLQVSLTTIHPASDRYYVDYESPYQIPIILTDSS